MAKQKSKVTPKAKTTTAKAIVKAKAPTSKTATAKKAKDKVEVTPKIADKVIAPPSTQKKKKVKGKDSTTYEFNDKTYGKGKLVLAVISK